MKKLKRRHHNKIILSLCWLAGPVWAGPVQSRLDDAVQLFEQHRLEDSMQSFMDVLHMDPANERAHAYIDLITKELSIQRRAAVQEKRLEMLGDVSKRLEDNRQDNAPMQRAIDDTTQSEERAREDRWHNRCEQARLQREGGHFIVANDLVLRVLGENPAHMEAQRELSELQSAIRQALDHGTDLSIQERFTLEGFYAFGQADYPSAVTAWQKARAVIAQALPAAEVAERVKTLRFSAYEQVAQTQVDAQKRQADLRALFDQGLSQYETKHFSRALNTFRQLAIQEPEYPLLGKYLVQAEAAAEQERTKRLGEEKRQEVAKLLEQGVRALEKEDYPRAESSFVGVLKIDPTHPQARSYLTMVRAEVDRRHDPKAAQMHYETGLIAYASGKLEDAVREWRLAVRLDPAHEKAINALNKAQKELALNSETP